MITDQLSSTLVDARLAAIVLNSLSAIASLLVIISYIRVFRRFQAHQRRILKSALGATGNAANSCGFVRESANPATGTTVVGPTHCFSCESSLATPCVNTSFFSPEHIPARQVSVSECRRSITNAEKSQNIAVHHDSAVAANAPIRHGYRSSMPPLSHVAQGAPALRKSNDSSSRATSLDRYRLNGFTIGEVAGLNIKSGPNSSSNNPQNSTVQSPIWNHTSISHSKASISSNTGHLTSEAQSDAQIPHPSISKSANNSKRRLLQYPIAYCNQLATAIAAERITQSRRKRRLPRIPSSKVAVLSGIDLLMHVLWIINTTAAHDNSGCTATLFFYQWAQLFYLFFLASFAARWAMRLRNLKTVHSSHQRRTNLIHSAATLAASLVLSLLPAVMTNAGYDSELHTCWFERSNMIALRWVWMSLNLWVAIVLVFLFGISIYVCVILSNERRNLLSFIAPPTNAAPMEPSLTILPTRTSTAVPLAQSVTASVVAGRKRPEHSHFSLSMPPMGIHLAQPVYNNSSAHYYMTNANNSTSVSYIPSRTPSGAHVSVNSISRGSYRSSSYGVSTTAGAIFGSKSTPLASKESLAIRRPNNSSRRSSSTGSNGDNKDGRSSKRSSGNSISGEPYGQYPAMHPVALAHEALHGRRPPKSCSRSPSINIGNGFAISQHLAHMQQGIQHVDSIRSINRRSSLGSDSRSTCSCHRHVSPLPQPSNIVHFVRSQRHHSDVYGAPSGATQQRQCFRWSQPGNLNPDGVNDISSAHLQRHQLSVPHGHLVHKPSHLSIGSHAQSPNRDGFPQRTTSQMAKDKRPVNGFHAHRAELAGSHRYAKHMSMPMPLEPASTNKHAACDCTKTQQLALQQDITHEQLFSDTSGGYMSKPGTTRVSNGASELPSRLSISMPNGSSRRTEIESPTDSVNSSPNKSSLLYSSLCWIGLQWQRLTNMQYTRSNASVPQVEYRNFNTYQGRARGQMQRIERRVHRLVTTGAMRVAARAMVPLITQLIMIAWSTMHSLDVMDSRQDSMYIAATILLSLQGSLDMLLYYVFDTQADASEISLQSYFPPSTNIQHTEAAKGLRPSLNNQPSLMHLPGDIYYGSSYDIQQLRHVPSSVNTKSPMDQQHFFPQYQDYHRFHQLRQKQSHSSLNANLPADYMHRHYQGMGQHMLGPMHGQQQQQQQQRSFHHRSASSTSLGSGERKFTFNVDSLNIRRAVDRTSNAMQSDTLNGSDCVAWSHMDGLSVHEANSISHMSTAAFPATYGQQYQQNQQNHTQNHRHYSYQHMPVLNGWREAESEEHGSPNNEESKL
ncbi:hypothetical protein BX070DRAFT_221042 [Coemansia spiralis]|nr:hypothetical protein BX070DRAFT_221042 [Coemansia spiralis]